MHWQIPVSFGLALTVLTACGRYQVKPPQPLEPEVRLSAFNARTLDDPVLVRYLNGNLPSPVTPPIARWALPELTLLAFYYHPDIELARARAGVAEAAVITAGQRPNPGFGLDTAFETPFAGRLPWLLTPSLDLLFERRSERDLRTTAAEQRASIAVWDIAAAAWQVRSRLRLRFIDYIFAVRELEFLREEEALRSEYVSLLETKLEFGDISRLEVENARIELQRIRLEVNAAAGRVAEARAALPEAVGISAAALTRIDFYDPNLNDPLDVPEARLESLQSEALLDRIDVRRALDEYAAAESDLQMELAAQRPDFTLGPAFRWREGQRRWTLGFSVELPTFNRNEGPIAEAEAHREAVAERFDHLQASVVAEVEQAAASYRAAVEEREAVIELTAVAAEGLLGAEQLFEFRDVDYTSVVAARLEVAITRRSEVDALRKVHLAVGRLEDAIQRPLEDDFDIRDALERSVAPQ